LVDIPQGEQRNWEALGSEHWSPIQELSALTTILHGHRAVVDTGRLPHLTNLQARLNCSLPGDTPLAFNRLVSVSAPTSTGSIYAVFTTENVLVRLSAVCTFSMHEIDGVFDEGAFKTRADMRSLWQPVSRENFFFSKSIPKSCRCARVRCLRRDLVGACRRPVGRRRRRSPVSPPVTRL